MLGARPSSTPLHHQCEGRPPAFQASRATRATNRAVASAACLEGPRGARYPICGRIERPAFPAPSIFWANGFCKTRAHCAARSRSRISSLRGAKRRSNPFSPLLWLWIASRSLSSGAHSRDPLARNDAYTTLGCLKVESEICAKAMLSLIERWSIAAVASTQPRRAQVERSQKPRPAGETGRGFGVRSPSRIKIPGPSFRRIELTRPPERCGGYAVRPARSGRSPPCNDTE